MNINFRALLNSWAYRVTLRVFSVLVVAWLILRQMNHLVQRYVSFQPPLLYAGLPMLQYYTGRTAILLSPLAALATLRWTIAVLPRPTPYRSVLIALSASFCIFVGVNCANFFRPVTCYDCFFPYGFPFTLYRDNGFVGGNEIEWAGLALDIVFAATLGSITVWIISRLVKLHRRP